MLDLSKNNPKDLADIGYEFNLLDAYGEPTDAYITVRGEASRSVGAFTHKAMKEYLLRTEAQKRKGLSEVAATIENMEPNKKFDIDSAVARVISWRGLGDNSGEIEFSVEACSRLLEEYDFIRKQVLEQSSFVDNFRPKTV